ncbi:hypothetical protein STAS_07032 [Striga asiatica]|uniref:Uncharacterized protein n=1 Tax=Striga asiatica TaxID=4170 RepID=A0A5A7PDM9_STRAF|nr:hypothetical protein STAS_07032 [Striga asiatica]
MQNRIKQFPTVHMPSISTRINICVLTRTELFERETRRRIPFLQWANRGERHQLGGIEGKSEKIRPPDHVAEAVGGTIAESGGNFVAARRRETRGECDQPVGTGGGGRLSCGGECGGEGEQEEEA